MNKNETNLICLCVENGGKVDEVYLFSNEYILQNFVKCNFLRLSYFKDYNKLSVFTIPVYLDEYIDFKYNNYIECIYNDNLEKLTINLMNEPIRVSILRSEDGKYVPSTVKIDVSNELFMIFKINPTIREYIKEGKENITKYTDTMRDNTIRLKLKKSSKTKENKLKTKKDNKVKLECSSVHESIQNDTTQYNDSKIFEYENNDLLFCVLLYDEEYNEEVTPYLFSNKLSLLNFYKNNIKDDDKCEIFILEINSITNYKSRYESFFLERYDVFNYEDSSISTINALSEVPITNHYHKVYETKLKDRLDYKINKVDIVDETKLCKNIYCTLKKDITNNKYIPRLFTNLGTTVLHDSELLKIFDIDKIDCCLNTTYFRSKFKVNNHYAFDSFNVDSTNVIIYNTCKNKKYDDVIIITKKNEYGQLKL